MSSGANYADRATRRLSAKLVPTFADRGYCVVSATDPHGRILDFLDLPQLMLRSRKCRSIYLFPPCGFVA
jgi:hypothetical protein